jgi:hypothetical protein
MRVTEMRTGDVPGVRRAFRQSLSPRRDLRVTAPTPELLDAYEALCLDWFLTERSPSVVGVLHDDERKLCGYALVSVAPETFASWRRAALVRYLRRVTPLLVGRPSGETARFVLLRAVDDVVPWRRAVRNDGGCPSARLLVAPGTPTLAAVHALTEFVDDVCRAGGYERWVGELDGPPEQLRRMVALGLGSATSVQTDHRTATWLKGEDVDRLSFTRRTPRHDPAVPVAPSDHFQPNGPNTKSTTSSNPLVSSETMPGSTAWTASTGASEMHVNTRPPSPQTATVPAAVE